MARQNNGNNKRREYAQGKSKSANKTLAKSARTHQNNKIDVEYNDPAWRMYNDLLGQQVSSYPFTEFVGTKLHFPNSSVTNVDVNSAQITQPIQIQTVLLNPSVGRAKTGNNDAVNMASLKIYTQLSSSNMKTTQYSPQDITMCILALGEVISWAEYIRRAFGLLGTTNPRNWLFPKRVMEMMGIKWDDFQRNVGLYRERFNYIIALLNSVAFPSNLDYFKQCAALYQNVFLDHTSGMAQLYVPVPYSTWKLDEQTSETGSIMKTVLNPGFGTSYPTGNSGYKVGATSIIYKGSSNGIDVGSLLDVLESQITELLNSSTLQYLYADVLKFVANNSSSLVHIEPLATDYALSPIYSEEFLINMENAIVCGVPYTSSITVGDEVTTASNNVESDPNNNGVTYNPLLLPPFLTWLRSSETGDRTLCDGTILFDVTLNFHDSEPDVSKRIMATRFVPGEVNLLTDSANILGLTGYWPDHYIVDVISGYMAHNSGTSSVDWSGKSWNNWNTSDYVSRLTNFSHPMRVVQVDGYVDKTDVAKPVVELDRAQISSELDIFTTVPKSIMTRINEISFLSLFQLH